MPGNHSTFSTVPLSSGHDYPPTHLPTPQFYLEVSRGRTVFRRRPITNKSFLIGSGEHCDLQLGGHEIPLLFGIIQADDEQLRIRTVESEPELKINGKPQTSAILNDGDLIEIGTFQFVARKQEVPDPALQSAYSKSKTARHERDHDDDAEDLSELSAAELLDRLEQDVEMVEDYEQGERQGWAALMDRVERRKEALRQQPRKVSRRQKAIKPKRLRQPQWTEFDDLLESDQTQPLTTQTSMNAPSGIEVDYLMQIERIINELSQATSDIEDRSEQMSQRDLDYLEAASSIMETQQKLAEQLQTLIEHVDQTSETSKKIEPFETPRRAIA